MPNDTTKPLNIPGFDKIQAGTPYSGTKVDYSKLAKYFPKGGIPGTVSTQAQIDGMLGWQQGNLRRSLSFFPRALGTTVAEAGRFFSRTFDFVDMYNDFTEGSPTYQNWATDLLDGFEDWVKEKAPIYYRPDYNLKSAGEQMLSSEFWGDEAAQGVGFWAGNLAPMLLFRKAGSIRIPAFKRAPQFTGYPAKVYNAVAKVGGKVAPGRYLSKEQINNLGIIGYSMLQTHSEAVAEASFLGKDLRKSFEEKIKRGETDRNGVPWTWEKANKQIALAMQEHYRYNLGVLGISNTIVNKMLFGTPKVTGAFIARNVGKEAGKKFNWARAKDIGNRLTKGTITEGFWEEGSQTSGEMRVKRMALNGDLYQPNDMWLFRLPRLWSNAADTFGMDYGNMLGTKEGVHAIALGAVLGSVSGVVESFKEVEAQNEFISAIKEGREKNILIHAGMLRVHNLYETNDDGSIKTDDDNNPVWSKEYAFLSEKQKETLLATKKYIDDLYGSENPELIEKTMRLDILPQIISFYASSPELLEYLELELKNEGGEFMEMMKATGVDPIMSADEIMDMARELHATHVKTSAIENMFRTIKTVAKDIAGTETDKNRAETFINEQIHGVFRRYEIQARKLEALKDELDASDETGQQMIESLNKQIEKLRATQQLILDASPQQWRDLYLSYVKSEEDYNTAIRELYTKSMVGDAGTNPQTNNNKNGSKITPEQQAASDFMAASTAILSSSNGHSGTQAFATEYRFKDENGNTQVVTAMKNTNGDKILLKNKKTSEVAYEYNPTSGVIKNIATGETLSSPLATKIRAIKKRENAAKDKFKTAIKLMLDVLRNNLSNGHINPKTAKEYIDKLESALKRTPFLNTKRTLTVLEGLNELEELVDNAEEFLEEYRLAVKELNSSTVDDMLVENPDLKTAKNTAINGSFSEALEYAKALYDYAKDGKWKGYAPRLKAVVDELERLDKDYLSKQDSTVTGFVKSLTEELIFNEEFAKLDYNQQLLSVVALFQSDNDDNVDVYSTADVKTEVATYPSPAVSSPMQVMRPAINEKAMLSKEAITTDPAVKRYLRSQLQLIDYYRNTGDRLPGFLFTIQNFLDGKVAERFGKEQAALLASKMYFFYTENDVDKVVTASEVMGMSAEEQQDMIELIGGDIKLVPMTPDGRIPIDGKLRKLTTDDKDTMLSHTSLVGKDNLLSYTFEQKREERYRVIDPQTGRQVNTPEASDEDIARYEAFTAAAEAIYDATANAAHNEIVQLTFYKHTSGAMNDNLFLGFSAPSLPTLNTFLKAANADSVAQLYKNGQIVIPVSKKTNTKTSVVEIRGMLFQNVTVGIPYVLVQNRLLPMSAKKLSTADAKTIIKLVEAVSNASTDMNGVSLEQVRNFIRSITHINSMTSASEDKTGYAWSFDVMPNGDVISWVKGEEYNLSELDAEAFKEYAKELQAVLESKFYNMLVAKDGKTAPANMYNVVKLNGKKLEVSSRSQDQYLNALGENFELYYDHNKLKTQPLVWNSGAQYSSPIRAQQTDASQEVDKQIIDRGNLPSLDQWDGYVAANKGEFENFITQLIDWKYSLPYGEQVTLATLYEQLESMDDVVVNIEDREGVSVKLLIDDNIDAFINIVSGEELELFTDSDIIDAFMEQLRNAFENHKPLGKNDC